MIPRILLLFFLALITAQPSFGEESYTVDDLHVREVLAGNDREKQLEVINKAGALGKEGIKAQSEIMKFLMLLGERDNELQSAGLEALTKISGRQFKASDVLNDQEMVVRKPAIYLYSSNPEAINIHIETSYPIEIAFPKFNATHSWRAFTTPHGEITVGDNRKYDYLFWEAHNVWLPKIDQSTGFIVPGYDVREFLLQKLSDIGLNVDEANDFIVYWYPVLMKNNLNYIRFLFEEYNQIARLKITPTPDSILRVFMVYKAVKEPKKIPAQELPHFERKGFTVVDWGGAELPN